MSNQSQHVQPSAQPNVTLSPETFRILAEKAQEFTQALLALNPEAPPDSQSLEIPKKEKEPDQIRCYRVPSYIVRDEKKAMRQYRAKDLLNLLQKAREDFHITSYLLKNFSDCESVDGYTLQQIGEHLEQPIRILTRLCSIFADYKPHKPEPSSGC